MRNLATVVPWVLVAVMAGGIAFQYWSANSGGEVNATAAPEPPTAQNGPRAEHAAVELGERLDDLRTENATLRETVSSQTEQIDSLNSTLEELKQRAEDAAPAERARGPQREEDRQAMAEQSAKMRLERRYGTFLANLGLSPDRESALREALLRVLVDSAGDRGLTASEYTGWMRDELAKVLSPKELAEFDEYQEELPAQMLRQMYTGEVNAFAPGLSEQTRAVLVDVLVEEALIADLTPAPEGATAAYPLVQRMNVYANAAARFEGVLTDAEMAALNRFLNQQYAQLETTVATIQRAEAGGATANVDVDYGTVSVEIEQHE